MRVASVLTFATSLASSAYASRFSENNNTTPFRVNGTALPEVNFDIGESYAGLIPINASEPDAAALWFWFFPTINPDPGEEIIIWFNGCSSLLGLLQENGPFLWQPGTREPIKNPWSWHNLSNIVYVEHAADTGYSQGPFTALDQDDIAEQFISWWKNFVDVFGIHRWKIYFAGESYAGFFIPYATDLMLKANDTQYYDVESILIYSPSSTPDWVQSQAVAVPYVDRYTRYFNLNESFMEDIHNRADECGYTDFYNRYLTFPPPAQFPSVPLQIEDGCDLWEDIRMAAELLNPCFDVYQIASYCPSLYDAYRGSPGEYFAYFNRTDVQEQLNVPIMERSSCAGGVLETDFSLHSGIEVLPRIIPQLNKTIIGHGEFDFILIDEGTMLMVQNMTWSGAQGFSSPPDKDLYVPYHPDSALPSGAGVMGKWRTERGLTFFYHNQAGHMVPQHQPAAAYRQLEFMLGKVNNLSERRGFTTMPAGDYGNVPPACHS